MLFSRGCGLYLRAPVVSSRDKKWNQTKSGDLGPAAQFYATIPKGVIGLGAGSFGETGRGIQEYHALIANHASTIRDSAVSSTTPYYNRFSCCHPGAATAPTTPTRGSTATSSGSCRVCPSAPRCSCGCARSTSSSGGALDRSRRRTARRRSAQRRRVWRLYTS